MDRFVVFIWLDRVGLIEKVGSRDIQGRGNSPEKCPKEQPVCSKDRKEASVTAAGSAGR